MSSVLAPPSTITPLPKSNTTAAPQRLQYSISEYRKLGTSGLFGNKKTMLIHGEVFEVPLPNPPHDVSLGKTDDLLRSVFQTGHHVRSQMALDIGTRNDPGPDLAVVKGVRTDYVSAAPISAVLIVEVSDSSLFFDTTTKAELYATAGVPEYWVLDVENRRLLVFRDPVLLPTGLGTTAYRTHHTYDSHDIISPLAAPQSKITVADLLP